MLGAKAQLGRTYVPSDALPGFSEPVVISDAFWHRTFGADPKVIGKKIWVDSDVYTVAGVMPPEFRHPGHTLGTDVDLWATTGFAASPFPEPPIRAARILPGVMGRLKPGLTVAQAQAQLNNFAAELSREFPDDYPAASRWGVRLVPIQGDLVGDVRTELFVLFAAVGFVLLIACVNLANLLLARSASRQREIAIRLAIGASRGRLIAQLMTESVLLATLSGVAALITVFWFKSSLLGLAPVNLPRLSEVRFSPSVLLFAFAISIVTGVIFGLAPALQAARAGHITELREGSRGAGASKHQLRFSRLLVISEIALSLVLLIGAGLLLRSFWHLLQVNPGFEPHRLTTARIWLPVPNDPKEDNYATAEKRAAFHREVLRRISRLAGVEGAALGNSTSLPMDGNATRLTFTIENRPMEAGQTPVAEVASVSSEYFLVLRTPLISGRFFTDSDDTKGQPVVLIDEALAHRYWPNGAADAVGKRIQFSVGRAAAARGNNPWLTIVGVVGNIKTDGFDVASAPHIYRTEYQVPTYDVVAYMRTSIDPGTLGDAVRKEVQSVDPGIPVFAPRSMEAIEATFLAERRFSLELLGIFAVVALLLAAIGIYGVMAYTFSRRTNEIGIRMAMGAKRGDILKMALGEGARTIVSGVIVGLIGSLLLTQFLRTLLFSVKPTDPLTFGSIAALLGSVTLLACLVPALRATRVDPLVALRHE
jgi:predicted permease